MAQSLAHLVQHLPESDRIDMVGFHHGERDGIAQQLLESVLARDVADELVLEVPETEVPAVSRIVRDVMEGVHELRVPLVADLKIGPNWLDMTKVESKD